MGKVRVSRVRLCCAAAAAAMLLAVACTPPGNGGGGSGSSWTVEPSVADPATSADPIEVNRLYLPATGDRGALAVVLHGTGAGTGAYSEITSALRHDGYHVIVLRYSAALGTLGACPDSDAGTYPDCHREFRSESVFGAGVTDPDGDSFDHPTATIPAANSIMNRLLKLVEHMTTIAPGAGWEQFQDSTGGTCNDVNTTYGACELDWSKVALLGHSQGAGVALYMAKFLPLRAVGLLSGTFDAFETSPGVAVAAPWTAEADFDTAVSDMRVLRHTSDYGTSRIVAVADSVGIAGPDVDATSPPFTSNRLSTSLASTCPWDPSGSHNSTAFDLCAPDGQYVDAWRALAGS